ncbi:MAG: bifunctional (p)ppGpp synthetase/guanosine-3',5'-bis(diphosphate) 3'-pyrophosphohydrolase [Eubacterium sp.]|nr:bifunctional (p)ppGpp synthetase/guanosine-3',5'-bis(diphosphate) 3'-pyrophosphohydrolase [Eubacterium sp.]
MGRETNEQAATDRKQIENALAFALKHHSGQVRKGSGEPFITHPIEVMSIMNGMGLSLSDPNLVIAGILHDTVEDTDVTLEMIREQFGEDVADLVQSHTEDKSYGWQERKQRTISELRKANQREKILILSDMLANMRSMNREQNKIGDRLWERFNAPKTQQAWYYGSVKDILSDLQYNEDTAPAYREMVRLYEEIFAV